MTKSGLCNASLTHKLQKLINISPNDHKIQRACVKLYQVQVMVNKNYEV